MATDITGIPNTKVSALTFKTVELSGTTLTVRIEWKVPSALSSTTSARRATQVLVWFDVWLGADQPRLWSRYYKPRQATWPWPMASVDIGTTYFERTVSLSQTIAQELPTIGLTAHVMPRNGKGYSYDYQAVVRRDFAAPGQPKVEKPELDEETGHVSCHVEAWEPPANGIRVRTEITRTTQRYGDANAYSTTYSTAQDEYDVPEVDFSQIDVLSGSDWWRETVSAVTVSLNGRGKAHTNQLTLSQPPRATVSVLSVGAKSSDRVLLKVETNANEWHPVTGMRIQKLQSVAHTTAQQAELDPGWEDTDYADDGECTALAIPIHEVQPDADMRTWLRVKTWDVSEQRLYNVSGPIRITALETRTPTASNDRCGIILLTAAKSGTSATVRMGWTEDSPNTGTELSWADSAGAWSATSGPETALIPDADYPSSASSTDWARERTVTLTPLTPGKTYWVRIRRYLEGSTTTYTPYSKAVQVTPQGADNDRCGIVSATPTSDGSGATIVVGITEDSANTGTELTWSTDENAWWSNEQPSSLEATWLDSPKASDAWGKSCTVYLRGLEPGKSYYLRARRYLDASGERTYSPYSTGVGSFLTPTMGDPSTGSDRLAIVSIASGSDGTTADLVIGWSETIAAVGTEVSWSDRLDAWESTEQPSSFDADWEDSQRQSGSYAKTQTVHIAELEPGTTYYVRCRRYGDESRGAWTDPVAVTPVAAPTSVTLSAPSFVARGERLPLTWAFGGGSLQVGWRLMSGTTVVAEGDDAAQACSVSAERIEGLATDALTLSVEVSTDGTTYVASDAVEVEVADRPTLSVTGGDVLAQPVSLPMGCSSDCDVAVVISAMGASGDLPGGYAWQAAGDTIWSDVVSPVWSSGTATVVAPSGLDLWDGSTYLVTARATDRRTGLASEEATATLAVAWSRKAPAPGEATVTPYDATSPDGVRQQGCTLTLAEPDGWDGTDACEVWRVTPDGAERVAFGLAGDATVTDRFAPFGEGAYRVAVRTVDGDVDWLDFAYSLPCRETRVDWSGGYVMLPYNLRWNVARQKDFQSFAAMDGTVEGMWGPAVERRASISSDTVKADADTYARLLEVGSHVGAAFVRTPDGLAFCADVEVTDIDNGYATAARPVSLEATQVALTDDFMADVEE